MIEKLARTGAFACLLVILVLSLLPGEMRPKTGAGGHFEHFLAYAGAGFLFVPGASLRARLIIGAMLSLYSGALEIAQLYVPGRTGEWPGFVASSLGAWTGLVLGTISWRLWLKLARPAG